MGDVSAEPSMEDILSSIKRIIAEEAEIAPSGRSRRAAQRPPARELSAEEEVLELNDAVVADPAPTAPVKPVSDPAPADVPQPVVAAAPASDTTILSPRAAEASRDRLEALSRLIVKPQNPGSDTLEGLVREMLRPMLREWLDAHLPEIVEAMVSREIERITSREA